ncbi:hypothetical protein Pan44_16230 [Caulifigura coniformis]|uniref:Uncharacterized protein n=1 Tax=Caulifigura coniformis TaxID=2527983 RepID=A0A517SBU0_9PLAN|nr:hypothetical protein [Caulifigura coniformis]QDT53601.1 hypothetical protein Pan44_16230 [Caulifigura coniformis]
MENELLNFLIAHTVAGTSHAPELLDAFFTNRGDKVTSGSNRDLGLKILAKNGYLSPDGKNVCYRKLTTDGGLAMHPILGTPIARR